MYKVLLAQLIAIWLLNSESAVAHGVLPSASAVQAKHQPLSPFAYQQLTQQATNWIEQHPNATLGDMLEPSGDGLTDDLRAQIISHLLQDIASDPAPTALQQQWVEALKQRDLRVLMSNPEHPNRAMVVVNIAGQAAAIHRHWQIRQRVSTLQQQWEEGNWQWSAAIDGPEYYYQALNHWLAILSDAAVTGVAEHFLQLGLGTRLPDNQFVARLAMRARSPQLYHHLWQQDPDAFSHRALAALSSEAGEAMALDQILTAMLRPVFRSQALLQLAEHHGDHERAQGALMRALNDEVSLPLATAALAQATDPALRQQAKQALRNQGSPAALKALARMEELQ